jgi:hypothetical protein
LLRLIQACLDRGSIEALAVLGDDLEAEVPRPLLHFNLRLLPEQISESSPED